MIGIGICAALISNCMAAEERVLPKKVRNPKVMDASEKAYVYIGTYTHAEGRGIYLSMLDMERGSLTEPVLAA